MNQNAFFFVFLDYVLDNQFAIWSNIRMKNDKNIKRLEKLGSLIGKYSPKNWDQEPSNRTLIWISEYDEIRETLRDSGQWTELCTDRNWSEDHTGRDLMA